MSTQPINFITPEQYLEIERQAEFKSEYFDGEMFARAGVGHKHNLITVNALVRLGNALRDRECEVYGSDMRVCVLPSTGLYTYPDISAVCGPPRFLDSDFDTLLNPALIIEVLSRSTEPYDRGKKFQRYKGISSLKQYVLVASEKVQVEVFTKVDSWVWSPQLFALPSDLVQLDSVQCSIPVSELYQKTGMLTAATA